MPDDPASPDTFKRDLGLFDGVMFVMGSMIGSGVFLVAADMTRLLGCSGFVMLSWIFGAVLVVAAALSFSEIAAMIPKTGGIYVFLTEAFGPFVGFLNGIAMFCVIQSGSICCDAIAFARWIGVFLNNIDDDSYIIEPIHLSSGYAISLSTVQAVALICIVALAFINSRGTRSGKTIQSAFTVVTVATVVGVCALSLTKGWTVAHKSNFGEGASWAPTGNLIDVFPGVTAATSRMGLMAALFLSQRGAYFAYDSWANIALIAGEVRNPARTIPLSLLIGTLLVGLLYCLANFGYFVVLPVNAIQTAPYDRVAGTVMDVLAPGWGSSLLALGVAVSAFGCLNSLTLSGSRLYWQMARDGQFFAIAGKLNSHLVPGWSLTIQAAWSCMLVLMRTYNPNTGKYGDLYTDLLSFVTGVTLLFEILAVLAVIRLRKTNPTASRPYKCPLYPMTPLFFCVGATSIVIALCVCTPETSWPGFAFVAIGGLAYEVRRRRQRRRGQQSGSSSPQHDSSSPSVFPSRCEATGSV